MAIIDEVSVVHTRPIQSGQEIHNRELAAYLHRFGLTTRVELYDVTASQDEGMYCCDRPTFTSIRSMLMHWIGSEGISSMHIGEDGYFGYVHFLFLLADITQSQKYADAALEVLGQVQEGLGEVKDDMSFLHGITGCSWLIEYLAGERLLNENPQELLEDVDAHIRQYVKEHDGNLSMEELTGVGKYYLAKFHNRQDEGNRDALLNVAHAIDINMEEPQCHHDMRVSLDALEIMDGCGVDVSRLACALERRINQTGMSQLEQVFCLFRLYAATGDGHLHVRVREEMKNLAPQLISLADALMLAEILYYKHDNNHKAR